MAWVASIARSSSRRPKPTSRRRLLLEPLEDRCVPTTITPTTFADGVLGSGSLRDAVLQFNADRGTDDDIIQLLPGTYSLTIRNTGGRHENAGLQGDLNLTQTSHHWIIEGAGSSGPNATIIDASQLQDRVFDIVNSGTQVVFRDLVIQGGLAQDNGTEGALPGTTDALGGGILNDGGNVTLSNVVLTNNVARGGSGAPLSNGHKAQGGGIYSTGGSLSISGSTLTNNQAIGGNGGGGGYGGPGAPGGVGQGGGFYTTGVSLSISGSTLTNNRATGGKGGDGSVIAGGSSRSIGGPGGPGAPGGAGQGAGLYATGGSLSLSGSTFANNQATGGNGGSGGAGTPGGPGGVGGVGQGVGLFVSGATISLTNSALSTNTVRGGHGGHGGLTGGYPGGNGGNGGAGQGGAVYDSASMLTLTNVTVATNTIRGGDGGNGGDGYSYASGNGGTGGAGQGGALFSSGSITFTNSTLSTNTVRGGDGGTGGNAQWWYVGGGNGGTGGGGQGGALFSSGSITFTNSTLSTNTVSGGNGGAGGIGNGFYFYGRGGNGGNGAAGVGGGIYVSAGTFTLTNGTVAFNTAQASLGGAGGTGSPPGNPGSGGPGQGGGVANGGGTVRPRNTLVGDNIAASAPDLSGSLASLGHNLIGNSSGASGYAATDLLNVDPLLSPLQNNGGPTLTHALLPGSPAIDAGDNTSATDFDQRGPGFPRIVNGIIDIGAFEVQAASQVTHYSISAPATAVAGSAFNVTDKALNDSGNPVSGSTGTLSAGVVPSGEATRASAGGLAAILADNVFVLLGVDAAAGADTTPQATVADGPPSAPAALPRFDFLLSMGAGARTMGASKDNGTRDFLFASLS
jgi:hypothetical protein